MTSDTYFLGVTKDDLFYTDLDGNVNNDIIHYYDSNIVGTKFLEVTDMSIEITFKYSNSVDDTDLNNNLHSYIDFQFNASENLVLGENLLISDNFVASTYIYKSGGEVFYNNWSASDYIDLSSSDMWLVTGGSSFLSTWNALYDENKNFIKTQDMSTFNLESKLFGSVVANMFFYLRLDNVKYIRMSELSSIMKTIKIFPVYKTNGVFTFEILEKNTSYDVFFLYVKYGIIVL